MTLPAQEEKLELSYVITVERSVLFLLLDLAEGSRFLIPYDSRTPALLKWVLQTREAIEFMELTGFYPADEDSQDDA